jgi:hypothetical protein
VHQADVTRHIYFCRFQHSGKQKEVIAFQKDIAPLLKSNFQAFRYSGGKVFQKPLVENYLVVRQLGKKLNIRF